MIVNVGLFLEEDGSFYVDDEANIVECIERNSKYSAEQLAYRYIDYSKDREGVNHDLNWQQMGVRVRAIAARLQQVAKKGDRVAILAPNGLEYIESFYASIYAGCIAVPLFDPNEPGHTDRLQAVLKDCKPAVVLTSTEAGVGVRNFMRSLTAEDRVRLIAVDAIPDSMQDTWERPEIDITDVAYLQYTSGSTRVPAGVEITHKGVITNVLQMFFAIGLEDDSRGVTWLPLYHDMGLLTVMIPAIFGKYITIMSPKAFVQRPYRWIKELGAQTGSGGTFSASPNFAYEHAAAKGLPKEGEELDLSNVIGLINGAEPVSTVSMQKFNKAFAPYGLPETAIKPAYGMAEATLFISATRAQDKAQIYYVDRETLAAGKVQEVAADAKGAVPLVSCGYVAFGEWAIIVDPETNKEVADGEVGEIWLHGNNLGIGYWQREEETEATFHNKVTAYQSSNSHAGIVANKENAYWMKTGDYGVYYKDQLFITGRVKDLIIVDGRNHYPQDVEQTAEQADKAIRPGFVAAFAVPVNQLPEEVFANSYSGLTYDPENNAEQLVIVAERAPGSLKRSVDEVAAAVRQAVGTNHGLQLRDLLLVRAGAIPRTSSGKIARRAAKAAYISGKLKKGEKQGAFPDAEA